MTTNHVTVISRGEPSDEAWRRSGEIGARILTNLAERDARAEANRHLTESTDSETT